MASPTRPPVAHCALGAGVKNSAGEIDGGALGTLVCDHAGIVSRRRFRRLLRAKAVRRDGDALTTGARVRDGDRLNIDGATFRAESIGGRGRLQLTLDEPTSIEPRRCPVRVHCGLHKCLTELSKKIYYRSCRPPLAFGGRLEHHFHRLDAFEAFAGSARVHSLSGHALDLQRFPDIRVVRIIRDPRDLVVSGYHYHRRGAEHWCQLPAPNEADWRMVRGAIPSGLRGGESLTQHLQRVDLQAGLRAEIEFRQHHYESMMQWPQDDPRVLLIRYEDLVGNEADSFGRIFEFLGLPPLARIAARHYARRYSAPRRKAASPHVRNAQAGQWQRSFSAELRSQFNAQYSALLERYGYAP